MQNLIKKLGKVRLFSRSQVFLRGNVYKRVFSTFLFCLVLSYLQNLKKTWFLDIHRNQVFNIFINNSKSKQNKKNLEHPLGYSEDSHRDKAPSNKTPTLTKSINMDIWVVVTSNQLFIRGSYTETN